MNKKFLATLLAMMLVIMSLVPAAQAEINYDLLNMDSLFPITKEPMTLTAVSPYDSSITVDFTTGQQFWQLMEKKSGIHIDWQLFANEVWNEQKTILLASGDYPDLFFFPFSTGEVLNFGMNQGLLLPLNEYLNDTALTPNINKVFEVKPELKASLTLPDGNIYGLGYFMTEYYVTAPGVRNMWISQYAEAANVDIKSIETLDDLYAALTALKGVDYNGNGMDDEIPWGSYNSNGTVPAWDDLLEFVLNAYGFAGGDNIYIDSRNGLTAVYAPLTEQYKSALEFLAKCYNDGLLDDATFTQTEMDYQTKGQTGVYAFTNYYNPGAFAPADINTANTEGGYMNDILFNPVPYVDEAGQTPVHTGDYGLGLNNCAISCTCEHPEVAIRYLDSMFDPYMSLMFRQGPEYGSEDMLIDNGWDYDEETTNISGANMLTRSGIESGWYMWITVNNFTMGSVGYMAADEFYGLGTVHPDFLTKKAREWTAGYEDNIQPYNVKGYPAVYYTDDQQQFIDTYVVDLNTYAYKMAAQFITGAKSFDEYQEFIDGLTSMKAVEYNDMLAEIYETYKANM